MNSRKSNLYSILYPPNVKLAENVSCFVYFSDESSFSMRPGPCYETFKIMPGSPSIHWWKNHDMAGHWVI